MKSRRGSCDRHGRCMFAHRPRLQLALLYGLVLAPAISYGAWRTLQGNSNSPLTWVAIDFPARAVYDQFCERFGPGDIVVLSWPGCSIHEAALDRLVQALRADPTFFDSQGTWYFHRVTSGRELFREMTRASARPVSPALPIDVSPLEPATAVKRLQGTFVGPDGQTTCLVIAFTDEGLKRRAELVPLVERAASYFCHVPRDQLHLAGPVIDGLSVDHASQRSLSRLAGPSALVVLLLSWMGLRSFRAALLVFGVALSGQGLTLALVYYLGDQMNALLIVLPPLIQVLAVSSGLHLTNYYFDAPAHLSPEHTVAHAIERAWLPCTLSAVTTTIGMASLMVSRLDPIQAFGSYASAGVLATTALTLSIIPAALTFWPLRRRRLQHSGSTCDALWQRLSNLAAKRHGPITAVSLGLLALAAVRIPELNTSVRIETLFSEDSRILADYEWLEHYVARMASIEVELAVREGGPLDLPARILLLSRLQQGLTSEPAVSATVSATTFLPQLATDSRLSPELQRKIVQSTLQNLRPTLVESNYLHIEDGVEHWRVTGLVSAVDPLNYAELLDRIRNNLESELHDAVSLPSSDVALRFTGVMPLVHQIQHQLLDDLYKSFLGAVGVVTVVMTLVEGDILAGLVMMVPNIFPILIVFGTLAWMGTPLDIGSVMTASVALGIAVDDTLHFATSFRRALQTGVSRPLAVLETYRHCGVAMVQTSVCCGLGLLVFALSEFVPTQRFALMMAVLLAIALAGDLILLPALLCGPCGRLFERTPGITDNTGTTDNRAARYTNRVPCVPGPFFSPADSAWQDPPA